MLKMRYLDRKLYREKYDFAYAHLISEKYQGALCIFLELRQLGFNDFELLESISQCYLKLRDEEKLKEMVKIMKTKFGNTKSEEIKKIEKQITFIYLIGEKLQSYCSIYNQFKQFQLDELSQEQLYVLCMLNLLFGDFKLCQDTFSRISLEKDNYEDLLIKSTFLNHKYQTTIEIFLSTTNQEYLEAKDFIIGFCYEQMKEYNKAEKYYMKQWHKDQQNQSSWKIISIQNKTLNYKFFQGDYRFKLDKTFISNIYYQLYIQENIWKELKFHKTQIPKENIINPIKIYLKPNKLFSCHYLFLILYNNYKDPIQQQQMIDYMIKYNPNLAEAYYDQYLLQKQENQPIDLNYLIKCLIQCNDSVCKFTSLALLYQDQRKFDEALVNVERAKKLNPFDSDILKQKRSILISNKNYIKAREVEQQMVILEKENSDFVLSLIAPYIRQYQFHEALGLLNLIEGNEIIQAHRILLKLVNYQYLNQQDKYNILTEIQNSSNFYNNLYQGHFHFIKYNFELSSYHYEKSQKWSKLFLKQLDLIQKRSIISIMPLIKLFEIALDLEQYQQLSQRDRIEYLLKISAYKYCQERDNQNLRHQRFKQSFASLLVYLLYYGNQLVVCQWINNNQSFTIPFMPHLFDCVEDILRQKYIINPKTKEDYSKQLQREFTKLQNQFTSFQVCFQELSLFLETKEFENKLIEILNSRSDEIFDEQKIQIFQNPYFYDPYSKLALNFLIKVFGYFIEYEDFTSGYYDNHTELWRYLLISGYPERYEEVVVEFHQNELLKKDQLKSNK